MKYAVAMKDFAMYGMQLFTRIVQQQTTQQLLATSLDITNNLAPEKE